MEKPVSGILGENLDVKSILSNRNLLQRLDTEVTGSGHIVHQVDPTARSLGRQTKDDAFVFRPKPRSQPEIRRFQREQEYQGTVIAVNRQDRTFTARLTDIKGVDADEEGEFSIDELNDDVSLVVPGALFTWTIGLQSRGPRHQRIRVSDIRFRRLPPVIREVIVNAEKQAKELSAFLSQTEMAEPFIATL